MLCGNKLFYHYFSETNCKAVNDEICGIFLKNQRWWRKGFLRKKISRSLLPSQWDRNKSEESLGLVPRKRISVSAIEGAKRRIPCRSPTCSDGCHSCDGGLWIPSAWINLELDPRRSLQLIPPFLLSPARPMGQRVPPALGEHWESTGICWCCPAPFSLLPHPGLGKKRQDFSYFFG